MRGQHSWNIFAGGLRGISTCLVLAGLAGMVGEVRLYAQATSAIQGQVTDPSGAAVPTAKVTATNANTGTARFSVSSAAGYFRISDLLPGMYDVKVEAAGFKTAVRSGITVSGDTVLGLNFALEIGAVTDSIVIRAEEPILETEVARISDTLGETEIAALPMQGRGVMNLAILSPGVVGKAEQSTFCCDAFSNFAAPSVSTGGAENKSNFSIDGLSLRYTEGSDWGALFSPNSDAVAEVRVSTNPYQAELGRTSGVQVQMATKGGTNEFHGTAHYTEMNQALNARPFFSSDALPDSHQRYFGGTFGGPLIRNRLFFFGAYEGLREKVASNSIRFTETESFRDDVARNRPGSIAAKIFGDFHPYGYATKDLVDVGSFVPSLGRYDAVPDGVADFGNSVIDKPNWRSGKQFNGRGDYNSASGKDRLFASYWHTRPEWLSPDLREAFEKTFYTSIHSGSVVQSHTFSPTALNEVRFSMNELLYEAKHMDSSYNIPGLATDDGFWTGNWGWSKEFLQTKTLEIGDTVALNHGAHNMRFGGSYRKATTLVTSLLPGDSPEYYFHNVLDFANDSPYYEYRVTEVDTGAPAHRRYDFQMKELSFFYDGSWKIRPNLTLNYGVRWEYFFPDWLQNTKNTYSPVINSRDLNADNIARLANVKANRYYDPDRNNFGPRLGFAWAPKNNRRVSIRGGFALLYDEIDALRLYDIGVNPPAAASVTAGEDVNIPVVYGLAPQGTRDFPANPALIAHSDNLGGISGTRIGLSGFVKDLKTPMTADMFAGVQVQLAGDLRVEADYKFRRTANDLYTTDLNRFDGDMFDGVMDRLNPSFNSIAMTTNWGKRTYQGFIASVTKRARNGWLLNGSYTYSHVMNNTAFQTEVFQPDRDWGRTGIPHVVTIESVWDLPGFRDRNNRLKSFIGGWQLSSIWSFQAGNEFTPYASSGYGEGGDFNADGQRNDRPDAPSAAIESTYGKQQWLNGILDPSIFPLPETGTPRLGTLPRGTVRGPGYARIDVALLKDFPIRIGKLESGRLQVRCDAFNALNRTNLGGGSPALEAYDFGRAMWAYQNRVLQLGAKFIF